MTVAGAARRIGRRRNQEHPESPVCWAKGMKALTLHQPWASLIAVGAKTTETRTWAAPRFLWGDVLAIHTGEKEDRGLREHDLGVVHFLGTEALPKGAIVAIARLKNCIPTEKSRPGTLDDYFGDYSWGRWAWLLVDVQPLAEPVPMTGHQRLWTIPAPLLGEVTRQLQKPATFDLHG